MGMRSRSLLAGGLLLVTLAAAAVTSVPNDAKAAADSVTFALTGPSGSPEPRSFDVRLRCAGQTAASATLVEDGTSTRTRPHDAAGKVCTVDHRTAAVSGRADEVTFIVRQGDQVLARRTLYSHDGQAVSTDFVVPSGEVRVEIAVTSLPADEIGTPVRAMAFNIWRSGTLDSDPDYGQQNLEQLIEYVRSEDPDVLFMVETYGSGDTIVDGLNAGRPGTYTGVPITQPDDHGSAGDNLWLFTKYDVEQVYTDYDPDQPGDLTTFNFGGARLGLPNGEHFYAFSTWLYHVSNATGPTSQAAMEQVLGLPRSHPDEEILATDDERRLGMATTLLEERLARYVGDDEAPVLLGGDLNTMSNLDWTEQFANAPGHGEVVLDWKVTGMFEDAGFTDTYRAALPDAGRYPGVSWSPVAGLGYAPHRIDYVMSRGDDVRVLAAHSRISRLPEHQGTELDKAFPFYSDHGAVVTDLLIRGSGPGPNADQQSEYDEPSTREAGWPDPPAGTAVPPEQLSATADTENAGYAAELAVDGDVRTFWHSQYDPDDTPLPHEITIDLGTTRKLSALRYQPRIDGGANGGIYAGVLRASTDGSEYTDVAELSFARDSLPKDLALDGLRARYLRLHITSGLGGHSAAAELIPYE